MQKWKCHAVYSYISYNMYGDAHFLVFLLTPLALTPILLVDTIWESSLHRRAIPDNARLFVSTALYFYIQSILLRSIRWNRINSIGPEDLFFVVRFDVLGTYVEAMPRKTGAGGRELQGRIIFCFSFVLFVCWVLCFFVFFRVYSYVMCVVLSGEEAMILLFFDLRVCARVVWDGSESRGNFLSCMCEWLGFFFLETIPSGLLPENILRSICLHRQGQALTYSRYRALYRELLAFMHVA